MHSQILGIIEDRWIVTILLLSLALVLWIAIVDLHLHVLEFFLFLATLVIIDVAHIVN